MKPKVSILTLVYNREKDIVATLQCIKDQTYKDYEIIVIDAGSSDKSVVVAKKVCPKARILQLKDNVGVANYNEGMKIAKGDYFVLIDSDAVIEKDAVEKIVDRFDNCKLDLISFRIIDFKTKKMIDNCGHSRNGSNICGYETGFFNSSAFAMRREVFKKTGGFNPEYFVYIIEMEFAVRAVQIGYKIRHFTDLPVYHKFGPSKVREKAKYYVSRNWVYFITQYLPLWVIPIFMLWSMFKIYYDTSKGYSKPSSNFLGFFAGVSRFPYYLSKRKALCFKDAMLFMKTHFVFADFIRN